MYEALAEFYDLFIGKSDWVEFAVNAVKGKERGADVGCGSGNVSIALSAEHKVVAIDSSPDMLRIASEKFRKNAIDIPCIMQNAEKLELGFKADFITAMCDVVNYMRTPIKFFKAASKNLKEGGLLVFDISSEYKFKKIIANNVFTETKQDITYVWVNSPKKDRVEMEIDFFVPIKDGLYKKFTDTQTQFIHSTQYVKELLKECNFKTRVKSTKERIFFIAEKVGL